MPSFIDYLAGQSMPAAAANTANMAPSRPGGGVRAPHGNPQAIPQGPAPGAVPGPAAEGTPMAPVGNFQATSADGGSLADYLAAAGGGGALPDVSGQGPIQPPPTPDGSAPDQGQVPQYDTTTQSDGSVLLHLKNSDGSLGPVVKIIPPPMKQKGNPQGR